MSRVDVDAVLDCPLDANEAGARTVRDYLVTLLELVWVQEQGFSGKRPFGTSGWQHDVYGALARAGLVAGVQDREGVWRVDDWKAADRVIVEAIQSFGARR